MKRNTNSSSNGNGSAQPTAKERKAAALAEAIATYKPQFIAAARAHHKTGSTLASIAAKCIAANVSRSTLVAWMEEAGYKESSARSVLSRLLVAQAKGGKAAKGGRAKGAGRKDRKPGVVAYDKFTAFVNSLDVSKLPEKFWSDIAFLAGRMQAGKALPKPDKASAVTVTRTVPEAVKVHRTNRVAKLVPASRVPAAA
ncbi:MAG TPA: hypothetical protein VL171_00860 [Verrucomicrobiae bacterium]|nr:hypothetical protein [Verrucomicrobiae bacterium]